MINTRNGNKGRKSGKTGFRPSCRMRAMPNACVIDAAHMDDAYRMDDPSVGDGGRFHGRGIILTEYSVLFWEMC